MLRPLKVVNVTFGKLFLRRYSSEQHHRILRPRASNFQWLKFKDLMLFYMMIGGIFVGSIILYSNIFIGPATLSELPEECEPNHWEYYRHPITRFIARYMLNSPQQDYEKYLHHIFEEEERRRLRRLENQIKEKIKERHDYQAYYYRPVLAKYHRLSKEAADYLESLRGD